MVKWALENVKFSKPHSIFQALSASIVIDEQLLNFGPGVLAQRRKNNNRRNRPRLEWYQKRGVSKSTKSTSQHSANSATQLLQTNSSYIAYSAVDMNSDGSILTFNSAMRGAEVAEWSTAYGEEIVRLIEHGNATFISRSQVPNGKIVTYSNPQVMIKMKDGNLV